MILLLAGTEEAQALAGLIAGRGLRAVASLAGVTDRPRDMPLPVRSGGFGGAEGFEAYLRGEGITAVVDATHPYAARIGPRSRAVCAGVGVPYLRLLRPGWTAAPGDRWHWIEEGAKAAGLIPQGATVFLAVGPRSLEDFAGLKGRRVLVRRIDPTDQPFPWPGGAWIVGRPSADAEQEAQMLKAHGIEWIVTKDAGGQAGRGKLMAARALGLPVVLLRRPAGPGGQTVATPQAALDWLTRL